MKNELQVFLIRKPDYASFGLCYSSSALIGYVKFTSFKLVSAKTRLSPCELDPVFVLKTKATR